VATPAPVPFFKRTRRWLRALGLEALVGLLGLLPVALASGLGRAVGAVAAVLARGERRKALAGLARAFPERSDDEREALVGATFRHLGQMALELVCVRQVDRAVDAWVEWPAEARAVLDAALARKKGVIFVSGHVGNWELLARRVSLAGYPCQSIARETSDPRTTALVERFRASGGLKSIWRGKASAVKDMLRALKHGEILGLLIDQDTRVQSVWVPFFGHLAKTPRGAADLALRMDSAVVLGFCQRVGPRRYRISMQELPRPTEPDDDLAAVRWTAWMAGAIAAKIRETPEQWVWMHERWRSPPPATPDAQRSS
jgi:KDO2-lipid IV(A) lauroyltransferase